MIEGKVPKDILVYKTKIIGSLSFRQLICVLICVVVDAFLYFVLSMFHLPSEIFITFGLVIDILIMMFSVPHQGMYLEVYFKEVILWNINAPSIRLSGRKVETVNRIKDKEKPKTDKKRMEKLLKIHPEFIPYK